LIYASVHTLSHNGWC